MSTMSNDATFLDRLLGTDRNNALLLQRIVLGVVMFPHGAQKLLGWYGGFGFGGTMGFFTESMGLPSPIAFLVIIAESLGALALIAGLATRISAFGIVAVMIGAVLTSHLDHGFFMNWFGAQKGEGYEYHLLAIALGIPLMLRGGGAFAVDTMLLAKLRATGPLPQPSRT